MGIPVLIDTSAWIEAMRSRGDPEIRERVSVAIENREARFCDFVFLELSNGISGDRERAWLRAMRYFVPWVATDARVWPVAYGLAEQSRQKGVTLPASDLLIAACAVAHELRILHRDGHFDRLEALFGRGLRGFELKGTQEP